MSANTFKIDASLREGVGKGAARAVRREKKVPAVIYGDKKDPVSIAIPFNEIQKILNKGGFLTSISKITIDGKEHMVIARDIQFHPVKDLPQHIDFLRVTDKTKLAVNIPVSFVGEEESPGLKEGGILSVIRHTVDITCSATAIPSSIEIDVSKMGMGDSVHLGELKLPKGATLNNDETLTVAAITAPSALLAEEDAEGEEGEEAEGEETAEGEAAEGEEAPAEAE